MSGRRRRSGAAVGAVALLPGGRGLEARARALRRLGGGRGSFHVLPASACFGFLRQCSEQAREASWGASARVNLAIHWRLVQGATPPAPGDGWGWAPVDNTDLKEGWMDQGGTDSVALVGKPNIF